MNPKDVQQAGGIVVEFADYKPSGGGGGSNQGGSVPDCEYNQLSSVSDAGPKSSFGSVQADTPSEKDTPVDNAVTRDEMLARLEAVDARNDARFKEFIGDVRLSNQQLKSELSAEIKEIGGQIADHRLETKSTILEIKSDSLNRQNIQLWNIWLMGIAAVGLGVAIFAFGQDRFSSGLAFDSAIKSHVIELRSSGLGSQPTKTPHK